MIGEKLNRLPRSLHSEPQTARLSGRDDGEERRETQEHSQEWLCHKSALWPVASVLRLNLVRRVEVEVLRLSLSDRLRMTGGLMGVVRCGLVDGDESVKAVAEPPHSKVRAARLGRRPLQRLGWGEFAVIGGCLVRRGRRRSRRRFLLGSRSGRWRRRGQRPCWFSGGGRCRRFSGCGVWLRTWRVPST